METQVLPLTSHCALEVGVNMVRTLCPAERDASGVNPGGLGYQGGAVGSRCNLTEQLLQRTWGNSVQPEAPSEKATPMKRPFLWKESSTAPSVEKDWHINRHTAEIRKNKCPLTFLKLDLYVTRQETIKFQRLWIETCILQHNSQWCLPLRRVLQTLPPSHLTLFYHGHHKQKRVHLHLVPNREKARGTKTQVI